MTATKIEKWTREDGVILSESGEHIASVTGLTFDHEDQESMNAANLIAAAPDLLEACKQVLEDLCTFKQLKMPASTFAMLNAALAKARQP